MSALQRPPDSLAIYINTDILMPVKPIAFLGDSLRSLREFPDDAKRDAGYQLDRVQHGLQPDDFKPMPTIGKGVEEIAMTKTKNERYASVWDALADTAEEAANLKVRAELMRKIASLIQESGWTQAAAAEHCGITQPRVNDLLRGRISRFSLDALVNIASALGQQVHVELEAA